MSNLIFNLESQLYAFNIAFIVGDKPDAKLLAKVSLKYNLWSGEGDAPAVTDGVASTWTFHKSGCMVFIPWDKRKTVAISVFVHELIHVISHLSHRIGQKMNHETDELHAYFAEWVTNEFFKRLNNERNRLPRKPARRRARARTAASAR